LLILSLVVHAARDPGADPISTARAARLRTCSENLRQHIEKATGGHGGNRAWKGIGSMLELRCLESLFDQCCLPAQTPPLARPTPLFSLLPPV
jgi:hypothetical protein